MHGEYDAVQLRQSGLLVICSTAAELTFASMQACIWPNNVISGRRNGGRLLIRLAEGVQAWLLRTDFFWTQISSFCKLTRSDSFEELLGVFLRELPCGMFPRIHKIRRILLTKSLNFPRAGLDQAELPDVLVLLALQVVVRMRCCVIT